MASMKAISLFSGQGGLDIGVERAGYEVLAAIEFNPNACETLRSNRQIANMSLSEFDQWFGKLTLQRCYKGWSEKDFKLIKNRLANGVGKSTHFRNTEVVEADIRKVDASELMAAHNLRRGELDLIVGGPPCQTFSRSGKRESVTDERGQLFVDFARFVDVFRPRWFILENVKGMTLTKTDVPSGRCTDCGQVFMPGFSEYWEWKESRLGCVCPTCFGKNITISEKVNVPGGAVNLITNEFERLGYKCRTAVLNALDFGAPQNRERLFIVGSRDGEIFKFPNAEYGDNPSKQGQLFGGLKKSLSTWDCLFKEPNPYHHPKIDIESAVLWVKNVVRPHDEPVTWSLRRACPTVGAHQSAKLAIAPFGVPTEQLARQQWHTLGRRQGDTPPVPVEHSYLSDEDLLRLQTFPAYWFVSGTRMERAFQIGNAVPPVLSEAVARSLASLSSSATRAAE